MTRFRRYDYSAPVTLLEDEENDFDTLHFNETGINDDKASLPRRYEIEENLSSLTEDFEWQITYKFSSAHRPYKYNNHTYGGKYVTYRRLYLILCEHFNGGEYFIDTYFKEEYPNRLKDLVDAELAEVKAELLDVAEASIGTVKLKKDGTLDKRATKINAGLAERISGFERFAREWEDMKGEEIASLIKDDIITCLETGIIPLKKGQNTVDTMSKRIMAGLNDDPKAIFYASGNLINNLKLFVRIGGKGQWQTAQGLMV